MFLNLGSIPVVILYNTNMFKSNHDNIVHIYYAFIRLYLNMEMLPRQWVMYFIFLFYNASYLHSQKEHERKAYFREIMMIILFYV